MCNVFWLWVFYLYVLILICIDKNSCIVYCVGLELLGMGLLVIYVREEKKFMYFKIKII